MGEMLDDYFKISIKDGKLYSLPKIVKEIPPYLAYLPVFCVKLAAEVDYTVEQNWFQGIAEVLGDYFGKFIYYYAKEAEDEGTADIDSDDNSLTTIEFILKNTIFPRLKKGLKVRSRFGTELDKTFTTITWCENLYKVFERCN